MNYALIGALLFLTSSYLISSLNISSRIFLHKIEIYFA